MVTKCVSDVPLIFGRATGRDWQQSGRYGVYSSAPQSLTVVNGRAWPSMS